MFWILVSIVVLLAWVRAAWNGFQFSQVVPPLEELPEPVSVEEEAGLTVVIAARNEERALRDCLASLVAQTLPIKVVVVDDRSTDLTPAILAEFVEQHPDRIKGITITELPEGWLGKCNALQTGAAEVETEFILFSDADVIFEPTALSRALDYARREEADQLVVFPSMEAEGLFEKAMLSMFGVMFFLAFPPHRAVVRNSGRYLGVGAFNMVRTTMYRKVHGHRFLRLQVVDDVGLGKLLKFSGGKIRAALSTQLVHLRWQDSLWGTIRGLEKNAFAGMGYSVPKAIIAGVGLVFLAWWPILGLFTGVLAAQVLSAIALILMLFIGSAAARYSTYSILPGLLAPIGITLLNIACMRSAWITMRQGGVRWRDSFYPLDQLKQFKL